MAQSNSILERIKKLLALAKCQAATKQERDTAIRRANHLMEQHGVTKLALGQADDDIGTVTLRGQGPPWRTQVVLALGELYGCFVWRTVGRASHVVGPEQDRLVVAALAQYCIKSIEHQASAIKHDTRGETQRARIEFRNGACFGLWSTVEAIQKERRAGTRDFSSQPGTGLVLAEHYGKRMQEFRERTLQEYDLTKPKEITVHIKDESLFNLGYNYGKSLDVTAKSLPV